jgi:ADP-ribose pyrophosphatase YjhB (NUDIX family)
MTNAENAELVRLLTKLASELQNNMAMWPAVFDALLKITPRTSIETVIARRQQGMIEVLLTKRPDDDPYFPGQWHSPGSFFRQRETLADVLHRISRREIRAKIIHPQFVTYQNNWNEPRGHTIGLVHLCQTESEPQEGEFFSLHNLPDNIVWHHPEMLEMATLPLKREPLAKPPEKV